MITTLKDKEVNITWKETEAVQTVIIRAIDLMSDWVCLQNIEGDRLMFWARLEDMDVIQVNQPDYDPNASESLLNQDITKSIKSNISGDVKENGESFIRASMEFLLPQASPEFYMASNSQNAFSAIYKVSELLEKTHDEANKSEDKEFANKLAILREKVQDILVEHGVDFED